MYIIPDNGMINGGLLYFFSQRPVLFELVRIGPSSTWICEIHVRIGNPVINIVVELVVVF